MSKATFILLLKTAAAGALGAIAPLVPDVVHGLPAGAASVASALVAALLLHVKSPASGGSVA